MSLPEINAKINFNNIPKSAPTLCIPRVYIKINESQIRQIFEELDLGVIDRIDIVTKYPINQDAGGEKYSKLFIHFKKWFHNENATKARERLLSGNEIKVIYNPPFFWKVSAYREPHSYQNTTNYIHNSAINHLPNKAPLNPISNESLSPNKMMRKDKIITTANESELELNTPTLQPISPNSKLLKLEDINFENTNTKEFELNINNKLDKIDKKIVPIEVKKILFQKRGTQDNVFSM